VITVPGLLTRNSFPEVQSSWGESWKVLNSI